MTHILAKLRQFMISIFSVIAQTDSRWQWQTDRHEDRQTDSHRKWQRDRHTDRQDWKLYLFYHFAGMHDNSKKLYWL